MGECLKGARGNTRFLDKRLAELEAAVADGMTVRASPDHYPTYPLDDGLIIDI